MKLYQCVEGSRSEKMLYLFFVYLYVTPGYSSEAGGWEYLNVYCRDNVNAPVDWWYLYKPAMSEKYDFLEYGRNFTYITPENVGRWKASQRRITSNSMLLNTVAPIYRATYTDNLAYAVYEERGPTENSAGSTSSGLLIADEMGGVWLTYNIPNFPDVSKDRAMFPEVETPNGYLVFCVSVNLKTLNEIAEGVAKSAPRFTSVHIPRSMEKLVRSWTYLPRISNKYALGGEPQTFMNFTSRGKSLNTHLAIRTVGLKNDIIEQFACDRGIILDVYDRSKLPSACAETCGVRNFNLISLKLSDSLVVYVPSETDFSRFSVSTAAHWQQRGSSSEQYWVCLSTLDRADVSRRGGMLICVPHYYVWLTFDNLKPREPTC